MKQKFTLVLIIIAFCFLKINSLEAQINTQDSLALVDLYNSTDGAHWWNRWSITYPVSTWYGVTVTSNRVTDLTLRINNLTGTIPSSIGNLTALKHLDLYDNQLTGFIPSSMGNLTNLDSLDLEFNNLSGETSTFNNLTKLSLLDLNGCHLTGSISFLAKLIHPHGIYLAGNQLSGKIPIINCANLAVLDLSFNQLNGTIPVFKKDTANLYGEYGVSIRLGYNNLSGNINKFDSIVHLAELVLNNNQLTGRIPASLNKNTNLNIVDFSNNNLSGTIPSLSNLHLNILNLENNQFTFSGMEGIATTFPFAIYSPQANINITQNGNLLSVEAGGTTANNTYKWYRNGKLYRTKVGNATLTASNDGLYTVEVTNTVATQLTLKSDTVNYAAFNNAAMAATSNTIKSAYIFPNPATTTANVYFTASGKYTITITDVSGKILQTKTGIATSNQNYLQLYVANYQNGLYFITISDENNNLQTLKLNKE